MSEYDEFSTADDPTGFGDSGAEIGGELGTDGADGSVLDAGFGSDQTVGALGVDETGDGHISYLPAVDTDGDGFRETIAEDRDGDGYAETLEIDTDRSGTTDVTQFDTDRDGTTDLETMDVDNDHVIDPNEPFIMDADRDGKFDFAMTAPPVVAAPASPGAGPAPAVVGEPADPQADLRNLLDDPKVQSDPATREAIENVLNGPSDAAAIWLQGSD